MSQNPDYVMSEPGQSPRNIATSIEAIVSHSSKQEEPSVKNEASSSRDTREENKPMKTSQDFLEEIILRYARKQSPIRVSADASDEKKKADRQRLLNAKKTRWRMIFSKWPRDPNGKCITAENSELGKTTPNKAIWGATLFDFYAVNRIPSIESLRTYSSGSKLAAWMKANGEYYAKSALEFAENEDNPYLVLPYDITELIQAGDMLLGKKSWIKDDQDKKKRKREGKGKETERKDWQVPQPWPPASPFDPLAYPEPWPSEPFTKGNIGAPYPKLQKYILYSHLPPTLTVHDPWNLLCAARNHNKKEWEEEKKKKWSDKTDIVHTYTLKTSTKYTARRIEDDKLAEEAEAERKTIYDRFIADPHSRNEFPSGSICQQDPAAGPLEPGPAKPPIFAVFPFQPPIPAAREAHLYLSPNEFIGKGNHSFVYSAEFELPRSTIMEDGICQQCLREDMKRTLEEQDGPDGERRDPKWDQKVGRYVVKAVGKPPTTMSLDDEASSEEEYLIQPSTLNFVLEYEGPYRLIHLKTGYQCLERGPYCEHIATSSMGIHPLTAKVKVAAKLSIEDDHHLGREAEAYQAFPRHFFQHWSGFNLIKPLKEPTPVGPLVPQFYGYYVPDQDPEDVQYLSPILLLEDCGKQIDPKKLTLDDQNEAAALVFRFHNAGWFHGSVAQRNILIQPGPLSDFPLSRYINAGARGGRGVDWSFRLIDFGRSCQIDDGREVKNSITEEELSIHRWLLSGPGCP